ncbi:MAG: DUF177 domain-containing protein [Actinomycetota bacterium]|nr:DUF177 domain-containing protein [Actinomycetota bacterium]
MQDVKISVAQILGRPGAGREIHLSRSLEGVETVLAAVAETPLDARLRADSVVEGILVSGSVGAGTRLQCARCLRPFSSEVSLEVCELFVEGPGGPGEEDAYAVDDEAIDLEPMLRDALTLALPLRPLCSADCAGLCGSCGRDLNEGPCGCSHEEPDPRWAGLSALRDKLSDQAN